MNGYLLPNPDKCECTLCGNRIKNDVASRMKHMYEKHPLAMLRNLMQTPEKAFALGERVGAFFKDQLRHGN